MKARALTWICRILVGALFIVSGLIKANDPLGFSYKLSEYFTVFGMEFLKPASLSLSVVLTVVEIVCGLGTLLGIRMRLISWLLLLMIVFFTFLTFYSAYFNKVTDCGCFGDALHLKPWQSFQKDVWLTLLIIPIFWNRNRIEPLLAGRRGDYTMLLGLAFSFWVNIYAIRHLPFVDFRPYKVGTNLVTDTQLPPGAKQDVFETILYYEKDGVTKPFTTKTYPWQDSTWKWVKTENKLIQEGDKPKIHDFSITSAEGENLTNQVLEAPYALLVVAYDLTQASKDPQKQLSDLALEAEKNKVLFMGLTATPPQQADRFRHEVQAMYPYHFCDETALKTMIRSNPGLMLLEKGVVKAMWAWRDLPTWAELREQGKLSARP